MMKKTIRFTVLSTLLMLITLPLVLTFSSCGNDEDDPMPDPELNYDYLCFTAEEAGSTVGVIEIIYDYEEWKADTIRYGEIPQNIEFSFDKKEWTKFDLQTVVTLDYVGDKVYIRGYNPKRFNISYLDSDGYEIKADVTSFRMTGKIAASGNIMTLVDRKGETNAIPQGADFYFTQLFNECRVLTSAPKLPATQLTNSCYQFMFNNCKSLVEAPELPATKLAESCYMAMFYGCVNLKKAPKLPATELAVDCYDEMFILCVSLKEAPELPATKLEKYCYYAMFCSCESLEKAPVLPAKKLVDGCYDNMFVNCYKLNYLKALFEMTDEELTEKSDYGVERYTYQWVNGVADEGTFVKSKNATWTLTGIHGAPDGWTIVTE